jgi:hypothetical protein
LSAELETFDEGPCDGHGTGVDHESEIDHDMRHEGVPFLSAQTALATILTGVAEKKVGRAHALMKGIRTCWSQGLGRVPVVWQRSKGSRGGKRFQRAIIGSEIHS